ncbi:hypothetical protein [Streptomyces sp. NPDC090131]|uniref:hypothetical protein n=1 Tax=Streptomyces sp. NPDC090131 TaxID=3365954 RepID=UPI0037FDB153
MALRPHALLPRQYDERKVLASTVDAWGRALWLICHDARVPELLGVPYEALVVIGDGSRILERPLYGVTGAPTRIDALPRGGFVVAGSGRPGERNGQVFGPDGRPRRRFALGSHLLDLLADGRSHLWTGYADEGVFGDTVSAGGLIRWNDRGNRLWDFLPPEPHHLFAGISAMNVTDSAVRAAYRPGRSLVEIGPGEPFRFRTLPVSDPRGLAVRDDRLLLLGGCEPGAAHTHRRALHLLRQTDDGATIVGRGELSWPNGDPVHRYTRPVGRGRHLYLRSCRSVRQWHVLSVPDASAAPGCP